jgi:hypothetical protein
VLITIFDEEGVTPRTLERNFNPRFFLEVWEKRLIFVLLTMVDWSSGV